MVKGCWKIGDAGKDDGDRCVGIRNILKGVCVLMKVDCCEVNGKESDVCGDCVDENCMFRVLSGVNCVEEL